MLQDVITAIMTSATPVFCEFLQITSIYVVTYSTEFDT